MEPPHGKGFTLLQVRWDLNSSLKTPHNVFDRDDFMEASTRQHEAVCKLPGFRAFPADVYFEALLFRQENYPNIFQEVFKAAPLFSPVLWIFCDSQVVASLPKEVLNGPELLPDLFTSLRVQLWGLEEENDFTLFRGPRKPFASTSMLDREGNVCRHPLVKIFDAPDMSLDTLTKPLPLWLAEDLCVGNDQTYCGKPYVDYQTGRLTFPCPETGWYNFSGKLTTRSSGSRK